MTPRRWFSIECFTAEIGFWHARQLQLLASAGVPDPDAGRHGELERSGAPAPPANRSRRPGRQLDQTVISSV
jgi:hypothetical protein